MIKLFYLKTPEKEYPYSFSINVMKNLQEKYGSFDDVVGKLDVKEDEEIDYGALVAFYHEAINEGIDIYNENKPEEQKMSFVTERQAGRIITEVGLKNAAASAQQSVIESAKLSNDNEGEVKVEVLDEKN